MAFLHGTTLRLCPVFFEGELVLRGEGPEDVLHRIEAMLAGGCHPRGY
jgi:hypothetical protein